MESCQEGLCQVFKILTVWQNIGKFGHTDCYPVGKHYFSQRTLTYFVRENITVLLTSCLTGLDSAV